MRMSERVAPIFYQLHRELTYKPTSQAFQGYVRVAGYPTGMNAQSMVLSTIACLDKPITI
jgi:hypothetical protein